MVNIYMQRIINGEYMCRELINGKYIFAERIINGK